ncbi:MAG: TatD family hydrolase [Clostridia bacterium]|nr:TatD family hydrolase [Clostridia bacterium]
MLFDSHAHYEDDRFLEDLDSVLSAMPAHNIGYIMDACTEISDIDKILCLADKYPFLYASVGIHPHSVKDIQEKDLDILKKAATHPKVKAVGEIGLDYYYDNSPRDLQKKWFACQMDLANELRLPVIIHDRDAHKDTMDILKAHHAENVGGVLHCFAGSREMAKEVLNLGMYIAFGGTLTFKNSIRPIEVAKYVPLDCILLETDAPYLAPEPNRGKRNSSLFLHFIAQKLAQIKGIDVAEVEKATCENAKRCFGIEE